jgi:hypothetical protein
VTELSKFFSNNKPCQLWIKAQCFKDHLRLHHQGRDVTVDGWCCLYTRSKLPPELLLANGESRPNLTQNHSLRVSHLKVGLEQLDNYRPGKSAITRHMKCPPSTTVVPPPVTQRSVTLSANGCEFVSAATPHRPNLHRVYINSTSGQSPHLSPDERR